MKTYTTNIVSRRETLALLSAMAIANTASAQAPLLRPLTLDHVNIHVSDVAKAADFYSNLLSGPVLKIASQAANPTSIPGPLVDVKAGSNYLVISHAFPQDGAPGLDHICYGIEDYQALIDTKLNTNGLQIVGRPDTNDIFIRDPDGTLIQLRPPGGWARLTPRFGAVALESTPVKGAPLVPTAINYIRLRVADLSRSAQFYQWLFGTETSSRDPNVSRKFRNGDSLLELIPTRAGSTSSASPGIDLMGVMFSDFSAPSALEILRERGIGARVISGRLVASDPDGIQIMLSGTE
jgi:catechol 2,3-dioxygenase-like lactoylglutathione lyase family enzyme